MTHLGMSRFRNGLHIKQLPTVVLNSAKADDSNTLALFLDHPQDLTSTNVVLSRERIHGQEGSGRKAVGFDLRRKGVLHGFIISVSLCVVHKRVDKLT